MAVAGCEDEEVRLARRLAILGLALVIEPLELRIDRGGELVARERGDIALCGDVISPRCSVISDARGPRPRMRRNIALVSTPGPSAPSARISVSLLGAVGMRDAGCLVAVGRDLIALGSPLVSLGGALVSVGGRLIKI